MSTLHLIPVGLGQADKQRWLPTSVQELAASLHFYIAENAKTARTFLKTIQTEIPIQEINIEVLSPKTSSEQIKKWLQAIPKDQDIGLVSEAGCPAVADPGAAVVAQAHKIGMRVVPWTGPSSIMLGLMASGLQGQRFAFHGYAPVKPDERDRQLKHWESVSHKQAQTQIFIETPYRNQVFFDALVKNLRDSTQLCIASALTCKEEWIKTKTIAQWRKQPPELQKQPALFLFLAT